MSYFIHKQCDNKPALGSELIPYKKWIREN